MSLHITALQSFCSPSHAARLSIPWLTTGFPNGIIWVLKHVSAKTSVIQRQCQTDPCGGREITNLWLAPNALLSSAPRGKPPTELQAFPATIAHAWLAVPHYQQTIHLFLPFHVVKETITSALYDIEFGGCRHGESVWLPPMPLCRSRAIISRPLTMPQTQPGLPW